VYVFGRDAGGADNWGFVKKIVAFDGALGDDFALSVAISGDVLVIGARQDDDAGNASGSAYVYARDTGAADNWGLVRKLSDVDADPADFFGESVAVSGTVAVIGQVLDDEGQPDSGSAQVFDGLKEAAVYGADCDFDGVFDAIALAMGMATDCNDNGRPDPCDIADGTSLDSDDDGVLNECEDACPADVNGDGVVDTADLGLLIEAFGSLCAP
jgi:hypothetical protein